jgi:hypothetical protein
MSAIQLAKIAHEIPHVIEPFTPESQERAIAATTFAESITTVDESGYSFATATYKALQNAEKEIEAQRQAAKRPIIDCGKLIDGVAGDWLGEIRPLRMRLGDLIAAYDRKVAARVAAYEAEQRAIKLAAELAERQRIEAAAAAERAEQARVVAESQRAAASDPIFGGMFDDLPPVRNADPHPTPAPIAVPVATIAPPPVLGKSAVKTVTRRIVQIDDAALIPRRFLLVDEPAVAAALRAGEEVPGASLVEVVATVAR